MLKHQRGLCEILHAAVLRSLRLRWTTAVLNSLLPEGDGDVERGLDDERGLGDGDDKRVCSGCAEEKGAGLSQVILPERCTTEHSG